MKFMSWMAKPLILNGNRWRPWHIGARGFLPARTLRTCCVDHIQVLAPHTVDPLSYLAKRRVSQAFLDLIQG